MPRILLSAAILALIVLATATCKKNSAEPVRQFKGKMVVNACGLFVVDIDQAAGAGQGQAWTNNSVTYKNAAGVGNYCYMIDSNIALADSISFNISATNVSPGSNCAIPACAITANPVKTIFLTDVVKIK